MAKEELEEKFVSDDGVSAVEDPVTPEGGEADIDGDDASREEAESLKEGDYADKDEDKEEMEDEEMKESFSDLFVGEELSEDFKSKATLVFEAAVNEAVTNKTAIVESELKEKYEAEVKALTEKFDVDLNEAVDSAISDISENLNSYLDYVVETWMEENKLAIESGIKVERAENMMESLKELFYEHNVKIDEETIDVVAEMEAQINEAEKVTNAALKEKLALEEEIQSLKAEIAFDTVCEGLTDTQVDRMRVLAEKLNASDAVEYAKDLNTLKESFFASDKKVIVEEADDELEEIEEAVKPSKMSDYDGVNALAEAIRARTAREK